MQTIEVLSSPCPFLPGSREKIEWMRERVACGLPPCLPGDRTPEGSVGGMRHNNYRVMKHGRERRP